MELKTVPIDSLIKPRWNPRTVDSDGLDLLEASIEEHGYILPVVVSQRTNAIISGNQRVTVFEDRGDTEIEVFFVDVDEDQEKKMCVALNNHVSKLDLEALANSGLDLSEFSKLNIGISRDDLMDMEERMKAILSPPKPAEYGKTKDYEVKFPADVGSEVINFYRNGAQENSKSLAEFIIELCQTVETPLDR